MAVICFVFLDHALSFHGLEFTTNHTRYFCVPVYKSSRSNCIKFALEIEKYWRNAAQTVWIRSLDERTLAAILRRVGKPLEYPVHICEQFRIKILHFNLSFRFVPALRLNLRLSLVLSSVLTLEKGLFLASHKDPAPMGHLPTALSISDSSHLADVHV